MMRLNNPGKLVTEASSPIQLQSTNLTSYNYVVTLTISESAKTYFENNDRRKAIVTRIARCYFDNRNDLRIKRLEGRK